MREARQFPGGLEDRDGQIAVLVDPRNGAAAAPIGRAAEAAMDDLAGMVHPDLGIRVAADPHLQHGFLIAPFAPAVARERAHRGGGGLVVVELGEAVLALGEGPFPRLARCQQREIAQLLRDGEPVVAQAQEEARQHLEGAPVIAAPPEHPRHRRQFARACRHQRVLVGPALRRGQRALMRRRGDDADQPQDGAFVPESRTGIRAARPQ